VIQGDPSLFFYPLNNGLSLLIIGDRVDVCYLIYRVWYLLVTPCEVVSQASRGVYLFDNGLSDFLIQPCRSDFFLLLIGDLSMGRIEVSSLDSLLTCLPAIELPTSFCGGLSLGPVFVSGSSDSLVSISPSTSVSFCGTSLS
jgi:hypothetical protein